MLIVSPTEREKEFFKRAFSVMGVVIAFLCLNTVSLAQSYDEKFDFDIRETDLGGALDAIVRETGFLILFPSELAGETGINSVNGHYTVEEALNALFLGTKFSGGLTDQGVMYVSLIRHGNENSREERMASGNIKNTLLASVSALMFGAGGAAMAQDINNDAGSVGLDTIVVSAQKREESLQDVPISINAFSGDALEFSGIEASGDLVLVTPGLSFNTSNGATGKITIRGVGSPTLTGPGADPSSSVYIDGVYQSRFYSAFFDLMDVERLEVLKGPQGTFYGRNSTGGAVKVISKAPNNEFAGAVSVDVGNYDLINVKANVNIPLVEDKVLLRVAGVRKVRDGYSENLLDPNGSGLDYDDLWAGRFTLKIMPTDALDITIHGTALDDNGDFAAGKHFIDPAGFYGSATIIDDPRTVLNDYMRREAHNRVRSIDMTANLDLGWAKLTSITGYSDTQNGPWHEDFDQTELAGVHQGNDPLPGLSFDTQTFTQELLLSSQNSNRLEWLVGLFYIDDNPSWVGGLHIPQIPANLFFANSSENKITGYAAFANLSYMLTDKLRVSAGARYSYEEKDFTRISNINGNVGAPINRKRDWDSVTPRFGIDYAIDDDVMAYFTYTEGFKSGAFNATSADAASAEPENISAYEVGIKSTVLDGKVRLNLSGFKYSYDDLQVQSPSTDPTNLSPILTNAAKADIKGIEIQSSALLSENLLFDFGLSWLDAEYSEFINASGVDVSGNRLAQAPEITFNIGLQYTAVVPEIGGEAAVRLDYYHSTEKFFNELESAAFRQDPYNQLNARMAYTSPDERWEIAVYGKNLTDEVTYSNIFNFALIGNGVVKQLNPPRTYGVQMRVNF